MTDHTLFRYLVKRFLLIAFGGLVVFDHTAQAQTTEPNVSQYIRPVNPEQTTIPGLSQAMLVENGKLLFLSGHVPLNADGNTAGDGLDVQLRSVFRNIQETLRTANTEFANVVRLTVYVRDFQPDQLEVIRTIRDEFVDRSKPPASALVGVAALFRDDVRVEVDAIAIVP